MRNCTYRCCLTGIMLLALSGCAGWLDPMVAAGNRPAAPTPLSTAIKYANDSKDKYFEAMSHQARLVSWTGAGLIPLAAATVGLAVYGNTVPVAALALTGASTYATAQWLRNQPAQMAYVAGYEATNCAVLAVTPFAPATLVAGQEDKELNFVTALQGIPRQIEKVLTAARPLRRASDPDTAAALAAADMTIKEAAEARKNGLAVQAVARTLGDSLVAAVDRINAEVNGAVIRGQPDLGALASVVGGIGSVYQQFGQVPVTKVTPGAPPSAPEKGPQPEALTPLDTLRGETATLADMQTVVAATVNAVAALKPTDALAKCGVATDQTVAALSVVPAEPYSFPKGVAHTQGFVVQGGRSPYAARVVTATPEITLRQLEMFGPAFVIESTGKGEGTYPILIRDGGGRSLFVDVKMVGAPGGPEVSMGTVQGGREVPCNERPGDPIANCATPDQIKAMQIAMCMPENLQDGKWGRLSREYLKGWISRNKPGVAPSDRLTTALKQELLQRSQNQGDLTNDCGDQVSRENLRKLTDRARGLLLQVLTADGARRVFRIFPETSVDGRRARIYLCRVTEGAATDAELISALLATAELPKDAITSDAIVFVNRRTGEQVKAAGIPSCQP